MSNGWIKEYEVSTSVNGKDWVKRASGSFKNDNKKQSVMFNEKVECGFVRLKAILGFEGNIYASVAEIDIIE